MLPFLVYKIFTFYINGVLNCKCPAPGPKGYVESTTLPRPWGRIIQWRGVVSHNTETVLKCIQWNTKFVELSTVLICKFYFNNGVLQLNVLTLPLYILRRNYTTNYTVLASYIHNNISSTRSWKSRAIPLPTLWATPGPQRENVTFF